MRRLLKAEEMEQGDSGRASLRDAIFKRNPYSPMRYEVAGGRSNACNEGNMHTCRHAYERSTQREITTRVMIQKRRQ